MSPGSSPEDRNTGAAPEKATRMGWGSGGPCAALSLSLSPLGPFSHSTLGLAVGPVAGGALGAVAAVVLLATGIVLYIREWPGAAFGGCRGGGSRCWGFGTQQAFLAGGAAVGGAGGLRSPRAARRRRRAPQWGVGVGRGPGPFATMLHGSEPCSAAASRVLWGRCRRLSPPPPRAAFVQPSPGSAQPLSSLLTEGRGGEGRGALDGPWGSLPGLILPCGLSLQGDG